MNEKDLRKLGAAAQRSTFTRKSYSQNKTLEAMNINMSLAKAIYEFLIGKSQTLPNVEFFGKVYASSKYNIMSMGYGLTVDKNFEVMHTSPIEKTKDERTDIISLDGYIAFIGNPAFKGEVATPTKKEKYREIDVNKEPIFDIGRVNYVREYLGKCQEYVLSFNNEMKL